MNSKLTGILFYVFCCNFLYAAAISVAPSGGDHTSIQAAVNAARPGDVITIAKGIYNEKITITASGTAGQYITIQGEPGAIISGDSLPQKGGGDYDPLITLKNASYIKIKGLKITDWKSDIKDDFLLGIFIQQNCHFIDISDCEISQIQQTYWNGKKRNEGNYCGNDAHAIAVYGDGATPETAITDVTITNCTIHDCKLGSSEALVINGNVERFEISDCHVYNCNNIGIDIIGHEGKSRNAELDQARDGVIRGNKVHHIHNLGNQAYTGRDPSGYDLCAAAIYVDGGKNIVIVKNLVYSSDIGIEIGSEHSGKSTSDIVVRNNCIYNNGQAGMAIGGWAKNKGRVDQLSIANNIFFRNGWLGWGMGELCIQYHTSDITIFNNIFYGSQWETEDQVYFIGKTGSSAPVNLKIDYNIYFVAPNDGYPRWAVPGGEPIKTFTDWQAAGWDKHSDYVDPLFVDVIYDAGGASSGGERNPVMGTGAGIDLRLKQNSPAKYANNKNDLGACEYWFGNKSSLKSSTQKIESRAEE